MVLPTSVLGFVVLFYLACSRSVQAALEGKIMDGALARAREFPYTVSLRTNDHDGLGHFCGGTILSPNMILTAATCTVNIGPSINQIVAGTLNRADPFPGQQVRKAQTIVQHPGYEIPLPYDDLAIVFLSEPFVFNENVSAIALPLRNQTTYPHPVVVNGWGAEQYGLPLSDELKRITLDTYSDEECEAFVNQPVPPSLLCTGTNEGGMGPCIGDAGAPVTTTTGEIYLAGILSHFACTEDCCGFPGPMNHNPEVAYYIDWILEQSGLHNGGLSLE